MNLPCAEVRSRFDRYAAEELPLPERRCVREHLAECDACRAASIASDPALLFAGSAVAPEAVSAQDVSRILEGVRAGVALKQAERRLGGRPGRRRGRASVVVAAAAVALFTLALPGGLTRREPDSPAPAAAARAVTPGFANASATGVESGSATVYEIAPGSGPNEPRVVWIVDRSFDI